MKKFWKIFAITLASCLAVVVIVVAVALYVVLTPKRLTPIVNQVADTYITASHEIGDVELTVFSTFPQVGLQVNGLCVVNPMQGAQSDTVLAAKKLVAAIDVKKYLQQNILDVREVSLDGVVANVFTDCEGKMNIDVLALPADTTDKDTAFSLPFGYLGVDKLSIDAQRITYLSVKDSICAALCDVQLSAAAKGLDNVDLYLETPAADFVMSGEQYLAGKRLQLNSKHTGVDIENMHFSLPDAKLQLENFVVNLSGEATIADDVSLNAAVSAKDFDIPQLLSLLPQSISKNLDGIDINSGRLSLAGTARGVYNDSVMPLVEANIALSDVSGSYMEVFPYKLSDINLNADAVLDLNDKKRSSVKLNGLDAQTGKTTLHAEGVIDELLGDPLCNLAAKAKVSLAEFKRYLESPEVATNLTGNADVNLNAKIRLSALQKMQLSRGTISGNAKLTDLAVDYDSIAVRSHNTALTFAIPNRKAKHSTAAWLAATVSSDNLEVSMKDMAVQLPAADIKLAASDVINSDKMLYADMDLSADRLVLASDSMGGTLAKPDLTAYVEYNLVDTSAIPTVDASLAMTYLDGFFSDIKAKLGQSKLTAALTGTRRNSSQPKAHVTLTTDHLQAQISDQLQAQTANLCVSADALHRPEQKNLLLQWNPRLKVDLTDGNLNIASFAEKIHIPAISFNYSNKLFDIADSRIIIGNSDFALKGQIHDIGPWLADKGVLSGDLVFTSSHTDVNELMALTSADSGTEETEPVEEPQASSGERKAYLVPKNVDLTLHTDITEAIVFDQLARELGGQLYIKDGVLVLEEMGFICNAAKLQLTAIYKTPRSNHIYAGLDYHMIDIDMQELVNMIPQIDTMMPMLRSFRGAGEFHLAAETYMNGHYQLKTSTTRGACSITGTDLVLLDSETFGKISKILLFNRKTENKIDSISAQATLFKKEIDIYPFCITMDKYMAAVGGRHNLDMSFDYHISLLKPLYIGVDVTGTFDDLNVKLAKCKYAQDFRPIIRRDVETQNISLKKMIDQALKRNVKP